MDTTHWPIVENPLANPLCAGVLGKSSLESMQHVVHPMLYLFKFRSLIPILGSIVELSLTSVPLTQVNIVFDYSCHCFRSYPCVWMKLSIFWLDLDAPQFQFATSGQSCHSSSMLYIVTSIIIQTKSWPENIP